MDRTMINMIMTLPPVCACTLATPLHNNMSSFRFRTVDVMMVVMMLRLVSGSTASQSGLLSKLATSLMPAQIIEAGKPPLTPQTVELAQHMLVLGSVRGHVAFEIATLAVQILSADVTVHLVALVAACHVLVADLLVHEALKTAGERAFERASFASCTCTRGA